MNKTFFIFVISLLISTMHASPIVDIETVRKSGEVGKFRSIAFAFSGSRGNEDRNGLEVNLSFANNSEKTER